MTTSHIAGRGPYRALRCLSWLIVAGLVCGWAALAGAQSTKLEPAAGALDGRGWLMRIHEAASHRNFQGTFVVSSGGSVASARIAHFCQGVNQFERIESLDGQARNVFRHNDAVQTQWPASRVVLVEQRALLSSFPALLQAGDDRIVDLYDIQVQGTERVAGHEAHVLQVRPRDALRFGHRLWAEKISGLLLRADVIGLHGEVLESSAFSDVVIGVRAQPESVLRPMKSLEGYRVLHPALTPTQLDGEGWQMRPAAPGFKQVSCVKRPLGESAAGLSGSTEPPAAQVLQTIFSDGLTYVSVFIEPYVPQRHQRPMLASVGATQTLMRRHGDWWVTVVGDVPASTLKLFADGLERR